VTREPITAVPTVEPRDRMNWVDEVATPRSLFSTVLWTARVAEGMSGPRPRPVIMR
jgi:hypothetical protein